jgi:exodeoxyribonuclease-3
VTKKAPFTAFVAQDFDILCLNETKIQEMHIGEVDMPFMKYPFRYWNCSVAKKGYSGVALFSKVAPLSVGYGLGIPEHDQEGRLITAEFDTFYVVSTYIPNSGMGGSLGRLNYRTNSWDVAMLQHIKKLEATGKQVIWIGDLNVIHQHIDVWDLDKNVTSPGCTPEERASFDITIA